MTCTFKAEETAFLNVFQGVVNDFKIDMEVKPKFKSMCEEQQEQIQ